MADFKLTPLDDDEEFSLTPLDDEQGTAGTAFTGGIAERLLDNTLGIPEAIARAGFGAVNAGRAAIRRPMQPLPPEGMLGLPSGREVLAGADTLLARLTGRDHSLEAALSNRAQIAEENPISATSGGFLGDAVTLMAGRYPLTRPTTPVGPLGQILGPPAARKGGIFDDVADAGVDRLISGTKNPGLRLAKDNAVNSDVFRKLARGAGRSLETGLEGAALAILQDQDPVETAIFSAAAQIGASGSLELARSALGGSLPKATTRLAAAAIAGTVILQTLKSAAPGGSDQILESVESAFDKVAFSVAVGALMGSLGRRPNGQNLPLVSDALATIPRGAMVSLIKDLSDKDTVDADLAQRTLLQLSRDPTAFPEKTQRQLLDALENKKFSGAVRTLAENQQSFLTILENPTAPKSTQANLRAAVEADNRVAGGGRAPLDTSKVAKAIGSFTGPARDFVIDTFADEARSLEALNKLDRTRLDAALEVNLTHLIQSATNRASGKLRLNGAELAKRWYQLPDVTRRAYPNSRAIETFIEESRGQSFAVLPSLLSRSLMVDGQLNKQLTGETKK